jgi:ribosomal protein S27AE
MPQQLQLAPVPASIDNPGDWDTIAKQITDETGLPFTVAPDAVVAMIGSAVPLLVAAQAAGDAGVLRGTFADPVVAQCQRGGVQLLAGSPDTTLVHLVGGRVVAGRAVLRVHLVMHGAGAEGLPTVDRQFWDIQVGGDVTMGQRVCPNCGAPVDPGELVCGHCRTDVRVTVQVPLVVTRLELY